MAASGNYTTDTLMANKIGRENLITYSDVEAAGAQNDTAILNAINAAEAELTLYLQSNGLGTTSYSSTTLIEAATLLACWKLYNHRGQTDESDKSKTWHDQAATLMQRYAVYARMGLSDKMTFLNRDGQSTSTNTGGE